MAATTTASPADVNMADSSSSWADKLQELDPKSFVRAFFDKSTRPDGRLFSQCRPTKISQGVLKLRTIGSSLVNNMLCGITLQVGTPSIAGQGDVLVQCESGNQTVLQDILTKMVDLSCLSIGNKEAFRLVITLHSLDSASCSGNLDTSLIAAVAAMQDAQLPATQRNAQTGRVELLAGDEKESTPLVLNHIAVPLTAGIYVDPSNSAIHLLADPSETEMVLFEGSIAIVVTVDKEILYVAHSSRVGLERKDLAICAHMAYGRAKEITELLL